MHAPQTIATNVRRLMAREGMTFDQLVAGADLDERTIRGLLRGANNPHARTIHKLATGLGVATDELFQPADGYGPQAFDRATNSHVDAVASDHPEVFRDWTEADHQELASRFGTGGELTEAGILEAAQLINRKRDLWNQISVVLETHEGDLLAEFVEMLYRRVTQSPAGEGEERQICR